MDNHMNRSILEHFEISTSDNEHEIGKITNLHAMRGIENGSLHFITVPRDQEYIDHSLLNPEYIAQFPNGFIVDFIPSGDGEQQTQQIIADAVNADLAFQGGGAGGSDEQERRLTAALLQLVNKPCHIRIGNETQVIVANKDVTLAEDLKDEPLTHHFSPVNHHHVIQHETISEAQFKVYQNEKSTHIQTQSQANPPLPPLTPIRRLARQRKNSTVNILPEAQIFQTNEINIDDEINNRPRPLTKKSLPHKKRISKKLKNIDRIEASPPIRQTVIYQDIQHHSIQEVEPQYIPQVPTQFSCELCTTVCPSQLDFFAHLKTHYEPEMVTTATTKAVDTSVATLAVEGSLPVSAEEVIVINHGPTTDHIEFNDFTETTTVDDMKLQHHEANVRNKEHAVSEVAQDAVVVSREELHIDEVEFSDTEDMLEGIRGVVDKVQESVENDSNDGHDWYSSNSLHDANITYKSEDNQNLNTSVENFSMFFKSNLDKDIAVQEIILPVEENVHKLAHHSPAMVATETYHEVPQDLTPVEVDPNTMPTESEIEGMLLEDSASEDKSLKSVPKRTSRTRKPKAKPKIVDEEFSEGDFLEEDFSSDEEGKFKKQRRKCTLCDKVFNSSNAFKYHELSHTGERPHQCDVCGKSFFAQSALKVHLRLHSGAKPYECEICKRAFRQWGDLKYHTISIHTNERNFQCEFCGKAFARRYSLVIHRRIHTSERNYKCEFCPKSFRASSYLQNHRKVHTGEKPYACPTCGKKFRVSGDLKRHTNIHGREKKKRGGDAPAVGATALTKTEKGKKLDSKQTNEQIIQFMPKPSTSSELIESIKAEPNILADLSLLPDDLNSNTHASLVKVEQVAGQPAHRAPASTGTMIYSDGSVEIYKTEPADQY